MKIEENRKIMGFYVTIITLCIICITIAYAAGKTVLEIEGSAAVEGANWDIHFENLSSTYGGELTYTNPTLTLTSLSNFTINFEVTGDYVSYIFDVVNDGDIPAKLSTYTLKVPSCSASGGVNPSVNGCNYINNFLIQTAAYMDGTPLKAGDYLAPGEKKRIKYTVSYKPNRTVESQLVANGQTLSLSNFHSSFVYVQA